MIYKLLPIKNRNYLLNFSGGKSKGKQALTQRLADKPEKSDNFSRGPVALFFILNSEHETTTHQKGSYS